MKEGKPRPYRPDREGQHCTQYEKNRKIILKTQEICGICGKPVDKSLRYPHPMSPTVDHVIPVVKGGHPSDMDNLQLAHWCCNRQKSDSMGEKSKAKADKESAAFQKNRVLPQSTDWTAYRG